MPKESRPGETRVAATPKTVRQLIGLGYEVIERGAGTRANFSDAAYKDAGAPVVDDHEAWSSDVVLKINAPTDEEVARLRPGAILASLLAPALSPDLVERLTAQGVTALAMDAVPRISRAQSLDVLSSMANIGGYRAVVEAAHEFGSLFTGQVTAAGKVPPAKVLVVGAGVAGLAAIGTASSLGAIVQAFDARPEVGEQVESMGAEFLRIEGLEQEGPSATGYAKEMGEDFNRRAAELYAEQAKDVDIIITTALIPEARPAPHHRRDGRLHEARLGDRRHGGVQRRQRRGRRRRRAGAHREPGPDHRLHRPARPASHPGLAALRDQPRQPAQAAHARQGRTGRGRLRRRGPAGHDRMPRRRVHVAAATRAGQRGACGDGRGRGSQEPRPAKARDPRRKYLAMALAAALFALVAVSSPPVFLGHFTVFALAVIVGFYVISNVAHALHTPLMSETNAISGIILVGALLQIGSEDPLVRTLAFVATVIASVNIFGGFAVTGRMLQMFRKD